MNEEVECIPVTECRCCECLGQLCMMYHPGHDHRFPDEAPIMNPTLLDRLNRLAKREQPNVSE